MANPSRMLILAALSMLIALAFLLTNAWSNDEPTFSGRILTRGSSGQDVVELQERLKYIGYLKDTTDGKFGWNTYWAVRKFQKDFGIKADGKVGKATQRILVSKTKYKPKKNQAAAPKPKAKDQGSAYKPHGYSDNDLKIMANAVYGEARGEPYVGQVAVAAVILNRVENSSFPNTPSGVVFEPRAFTAVADGQIWLTPNENAKKAVQDALNGTDPTGGCIYYFNPDTATSGWIWTRAQVKKIGKHIFCK
ncbi:spore cortex-lytic enzyme [Ammoniphilus sp. 3BR4]|uniref:spore cortex-lytic enzyme n=1 Tax=Ammoniphilus sp. 3BR4 TaxID=3158265 RepID=UPI003466062D